MVERKQSCWCLEGPSHEGQEADLRVLRVVCCQVTAQSPLVFGLLKAFCHRLLF